MTWKITYKLNPPIDVAANKPTYPELSVCLFYDGDGRLVSVEHELELAESTAPTSAIESSTDRLRLFWESLNYKRGAPLTIGQTTTEILHPPSPSTPVRTGMIVISSRSVVVRPIEFPDGTSLATPTPRLSAWLRLANSARDDDDDANALRDYFMVIEDIGLSGPKVEEVRMVRHFVSHGGTLWPKTKAYIEKRLGMAVVQYDPTDQNHRTLVRECRQTARQIVETEIDKLLK